MTAGVSFSRWRMLATERAGGDAQMSLDQALLESAAGAGFPPTLRFHLWEPPGLSIGRFQDISDVDLAACAGAGIGVVRRPTGGKSILHADDFTYSVVLPAAFPLPDSVEETYAVLCRGILSALRRLGLQATMRRRSSEDYTRCGGACFAALTGADLECEGRKICGSAQVRRRGAVLQHGTILLRDRSELLFELLRYEDEEGRREARAAYQARCISLAETAPDLGWDELAASFRAGFGESFDTVLEDGGLTEWEDERWRALMPLYGSREWLINATLKDSPSPER